MQFLFGGRVNDDQAPDFAPIAASPNVTYVGPIETSLTHDFMSSLAVGLIPFAPGWAADRINPVKMSEFVPTVSPS